MQDSDNNQAAMLELFLHKVIIRLSQESCLSWVLSGDNLNISRCNCATSSTRVTLKELFYFKRASCED